MKLIVNIPYLLIQNAVQNIFCCSKMLISLLIISYFSRYRMKARHHKGNTRACQKPQEGRGGGANSCIRRKTRTEDQRLWKAFELLTSCSNDATNDECQNFGNMTAAKLMDYNDTIRCAMQNEIMNIFLNAKRVLWMLYHSHLRPLNHLNPTPKAVHTKCTLTVPINPPPHSSPAPLHSQNPPPSPFNQHNNSTLSQSFLTASISPVTISLEEVANIRALLEQCGPFLIEAFQLSCL